MEKDKKQSMRNTKLVSRHPQWLDAIVPTEYEDDQLCRILLFFVIHSPCPGQSARSITLDERGWKKKPWYSPKYLKEKIDCAIWKDQTPRMKQVDSKGDLLKQIQTLDMDDDFYSHREVQRALFVKSAKDGCTSAYMNLFYHLRNAFAHGRLAMFPAKKDIVFVLEDGKEIGAAKDDQFEVSARIVINKSSLLRIIELLENPPAENEYTEDILSAIDAGKHTKSNIMEELKIDETTFKRDIQKLKLNRLVKYEHKKWVRT